MTEIIYLLSTTIIALCIIAGRLKIINSNLKETLTETEQKLNQHIWLIEKKDERLKEMRSTAAKNMALIESLNKQLKFNRHGKN